MLSQTGQLNVVLPGAVFQSAGQIQVGITVRYADKYDVLPIGRPAGVEVVLFCQMDQVHAVGVA